LGARQTRQILGPDRILCNHDSFGRGWRYLEELVYFPLVDAYSDCIMRGESERLRFGLHDFLRWIVSGYNISNAVGYWAYYGRISMMSMEGRSVSTKRACVAKSAFRFAIRCECQRNRTSYKRLKTRFILSDWVSIGAKRGLVGELPRFDRQYYDRVESLRRAWNDTARFSVNDQIQTTAQVEVRATPRRRGRSWAPARRGRGRQDSGWSRRRWHFLVEQPVRHRSERLDDARSFR